MCDRNGIVEGAIPGLANAAVVTVDECRQAIGILLAPDPDSRTREFDGRRIEEVDGGWRILNHQKHKDKLGLSSEANRVRVARCRARKAAKGEDVTLGNARNCQSNDLDPRSLDQDQRREADAKDTTAATTGSKISCPPSLHLTPDQRATLETSMIPGWAIDMMTTDFVGRYVADPSDKRAMTGWLKCLSRAITQDWNSGKRPKRPSAEAKVGPSGNQVVSAADVGLPGL